MIFRSESPRLVTLRDDLRAVTVLNAILRVELPGDLVRRTPNHWVRTKCNHLLPSVPACVQRDRDNDWGSSGALRERTPGSGATKRPAGGRDLRPALSGSKRTLFALLLVETVGSRTYRSMS